METPLTDVINRNLKVALANSTRNQVSDMQAVSASPQLIKTTDKQVSQIDIKSQTSTQYKKGFFCTMLIFGPILYERLQKKKLVP